MQWLVASKSFVGLSPVLLLSANSSFILHDFYYQLIGDFWMLSLVHAVISTSTAQTFKLFSSSISHISCLRGITGITSYNLGLVTATEVLLSFLLLYVFKNSCLSVPFGISRSFCQLFHKLYGVESSKSLLYI